MGPLLGVWDFGGLDDLAAAVVLGFACLGAAFLAGLAVVVTITVVARNRKARRKSQEQADG